MLQLFSGDVDDSVPVAVESSVMCEANHGYILKDGRFFACNYHHHSELARRIFKHVFNKEVDDPEKEADNSGWIRVQKSAITNGYNCSICKKPTSKQMSTFLFWGSMHGVTEEELIVNY